jgi:hypothetical protein
MLLCVGRIVSKSDSYRARSLVQDPAQKEYTHRTAVMMAKLEFKARGLGQNGALL